MPYPKILFVQWSTETPGIQWGIVFQNNGMQLFKNILENYFKLLCNLFAFKDMKEVASIRRKLEIQTWPDG